MKTIFNILGSKALIIILALYTLLITLEVTFKISCIIWDTIPSMTMSLHLIDSTEEILNNIATILVAVGVFFETREIFTRLANKDETSLQHRLNHIAEENGAGLLIVGLFLELICASIDMPDSFINTNGIEVYLFMVGVLLLLLVIPIIFDLIRDFFKNK